MKMNSLLKNGKHFIIIDYDNLSFKDIVLDCYNLQIFFKLPTMRIFRVKKGYYRAVCFKFLSFEKLMTILLRSKCPKWFCYFSFMDGMVSVDGSLLNLVKTLKSDVKEDVCLSNMKVVF